MTEGATVDGVDFFTVSQGDPENAVAESGQTATGSGKSLKLTSALTPVEAGRPDSYGNMSPTWIEYVVKPGVGVDSRDVPASGVAAVDFVSTGDVMVADGSVWVKSGATFTANTWYHVALKLDFSTHLYSFYCWPEGIPKTPFVPNKENLHFINGSVNTMSELGFIGAFREAAVADSRVDEIVVHTIDKLQITSSPQTIVKGYASGLITVQLQNANSEPQTAWTDLAIELRSSSGTGEFSLDKNDWVPVTSVVLPEGSREISFYFKDFELGHPMITLNEYPDRGWTDAVQEQKIVSEGEYFGITTTTPQVAGKPFSVQIVAKDSEGSPDTSYAGPADIYATYVSPASGSKIITPETAAEFVLGFKEVVMAYPDAGTIKITVRDRNTGSKIGYSGDIVFVPDSFAVSAGDRQTVSKVFPLTVSALGADGQAAPNYQGPAKLEVVPVSPENGSGGALAPAELDPTLFQNGVATLDTSYNRWGSIKITAKDSGFPEHQGQSGPVSFVPKSISVKVKPPSATRNFFYANENMELTVSLLDENALPVENFKGTVSITPVPQFNVPASYDFTEADKGNKTFVVPAPAAGNYKVKASDVAGGLNDESENIEVKDATIQVSSSSAPVGTTAVVIQLLDSRGRRITSENEMTITILFQEENENGTVFFSELGKPILFKNGVAKIIIGNTEAEAVDIIAKSRLGLKVVNGRVTFGRAGSSGVGALMLRETKD